MRGLKDLFESLIRHIETLPISLAGVLGLTAGLLIGIEMLLTTGGDWGLALFAVALLFPVLLGWVARPVMVPIANGDYIEPDAPKQRETPTVIVPPLLDMMPIQAGSFRMGSNKNKAMAEKREFPAHTVNLSAFQMARTQLTREQYIAVMGENRAPDQWRQEPNPALPANYLSWFDAVDFCNTLSERECFQPSYQRKDGHVQWISTAEGYRLPTEAEWEYACRAGSTTRWFFRNNNKWFFRKQLKNYAWYKQNSQHEIHSVAELKPNGFNLYDMSGNVWEWCWDWYDDYSKERQNNPQGADSGTFRSLRGGSAWDGAVRLRSAGRRGLWPVRRSESIGFRCVRAPTASR